MIATAGVGGKLELVFGKGAKAKGQAVVRGVVLLPSASYFQPSPAGQKRREGSNVAEEQNIARSMGSEQRLRTKVEGLYQVCMCLDTCCLFMGWSCGARTTTALR